jgi:hypothetical protein
VLIGYWSGEGAKGWPSPDRFVDASWNADEREIVAEYIERGFVTRACMGLSPCRMCGRPNGALELTDGVYVWPEGLVHYIRDHNVRLPAIFVDHVLATVDLLGETTYDETWWRSLAEPS